MHLNHILHDPPQGWGGGEAACEHRQFIKHRHANVQNPGQILQRKGGLYVPTKCSLMVLLGECMDRLCGVLSQSDVMQHTQLINGTKCFLADISALVMHAFFSVLR